MSMIKRFYRGYIKAEEMVVGALLVAITVLVFSSAIMRSLGKPIIWATDISTFFFAWEVFLGGDILVRNTGLSGVEVLSNRFSPKIQKALKLLWFVLIVCFCAVLAFYGTKLCLSNTKRTFQALRFSYSWCTLSVPVGGVLMMISAAIRIHEIIRTPESYWTQTRKNRADKKGVSK